MLLTDYKELFEQYYQKEYDFDTNSLHAEEITEIKRMVREKRVDYALAPMGSHIFTWILKQNSNIRFELVSFDSENIDGMLYIPTMRQERAYIILNANKPLINQIFTAAHEFYHYEKDYLQFKSNPYICDFNALKDVNEKRASRFAAELLLPEAALAIELRGYLQMMHLGSQKDMQFDDYAVLSIFLTLRYELPLKAVIYRLAEENYIDDIHKYIENYDFIKKVLQEIQVFRKQVNKLYGNENDYLPLGGTIYQNMEKAYLTGNVSKEELIQDAKKLNLDLDLLYDFLVDENDESDIEDDELLFSVIQGKWGE